MDGGVNCNSDLEACGVGNVAKVIDRAGTGSRSDLVDDDCFCACCGDWSFNVIAKLAKRSSGDEARRWVQRASN